VTPVTPRAVAEWCVGRVARVPASVHTKLLAAFLAIVALLLALGAVGLHALRAANLRAEQLALLRQKHAAYRELQHDALVQNDSVSTALMAGDRAGPAAGGRALGPRARVEFEVLLRQATQFRQDYDRLQSLAGDVTRFLGPIPEEASFLAQIRTRDDQFTAAVARVVQLVRAGRVDEGRRELLQAAGLADELETATGRLVVLTDAHVTTGVQQTRAAYVRSQWVVVGFAVGSIGLALLLGYVISWSLIGPVKRMDAQLKQIASGDFSRRSAIANRDELGALAANLNRVSEDLGRLYHELAAASRHKSQFLANMSHELRTPLNAILGYTELVLDEIYGPVPEKIRQVLERVQSNGRHLLTLVNDVLDLSKIEAGQLVLSFTEYSLPEVIQTVAAAVESLAAEKHLRLRMAVPPDLPRGCGDERRITQVLLNLVGNAIKFTEAGEVAIRAAVEDGRFLVAVSDTGPGIPEQDQQKIFEEFQQGDSSATRPKGGTGLGLSIARRIVELHRGRLWVESSPRRGSTFWVSLPLLPDRSTVVSTPP
jgi:signal transduction histidine kinase